VALASTGKDFRTAQAAGAEKVGIMRQILDEHIHQQHDREADAQGRQPFRSNRLRPPRPARQRPRKPGIDADPTGNWRFAFCNLHFAILFMRDCKLPIANLDSLGEHLRLFSHDYLSLPQLYLIEWADVQAD
jgi:hypothetical protein